jgi:putative membrane fusion protein
MGTRTVYVLVALLVISIFSTVGTVVYHFGNHDYKTETAILTTVSDSMTVDAVFMRDETVITSNEEGVISYNVSDASKLSQGSVIATIYQTDEDVDIESKINKLEEKVKLLEAVQNPGTSLSAQPSYISEKITDTYRTLLHNREQSDIADVLASRSELTQFFATYQILTDDSADFAKTIISLNAQIAELKAKQNDPVATIKSDKSAYFIGYADGYEQDFSTDRIDAVTPDEIRAVNDTGAIDDSNIVGKLVDGYKWYAAAVIDNSDGSFAEGDSITIRFSSTAKEAAATVERIRNYDDTTTVIVVSSEDFDSDFVQHRKDKIQLVKDEITGIKIPRTAIRFGDYETTETDESGNEQTTVENVKGVYVLNGEEYEFKPIEILYETDEYAICKSSSESGYLSLYDSVITEGVNSNGT